MTKWRRPFKTYCIKCDWFMVSTSVFVSFYVQDSTMTRVHLFVVLCLVISNVKSQLSEHDSYEAFDTSEETMDFEDSSVNYMSCIEEGTCIPVDFPEKTAASYMTEAPEYSLLEDEGYLQDEQAELYTSSKSHYSKLCKKLSKKMKELEYLHPELKQLMFKLLKMLDAPGSSFNLECKKGESIVAKILDLVIYLAGKLKADFAKVSNEVPILVSTSIPSEEIIAEEHDVAGFVGSVRGIPGEHYPNYSEVPITSFSCSDKKYIPGFYADLETGCQVFHVCYEHRRESFLCPIGTIFNQPILACDYWYSSNCSQAPLYYDVNKRDTKHIEVSKEESNIGELITAIIEGDKSKHVKKPDIVIPKGDLNDLLKFLPIKAKIVEFQQPKVIPSRPKIVIPKPIVLPIAKPLPLVKPKLMAKVAAKVPLAKAKFVAAAVPMAKGKIAVAVPLVKAKVAVPVIKSKFVALPLMKTKYAAAAKVPVFKAKTTAKVIPFVKMTAGKSKVAAGVPIAKAKFAKAAMISPLTKKALALGYMKLLKAKKLALMG